MPPPPPAILVLGGEVVVIDFFDISPKLNVGAIVALADAKRLILGSESLVCTDFCVSLLLLLLLLLLLVKLVAGVTELGPNLNVDTLLSESLVAAGCSFLDSVTTFSVEFDLNMNALATVNEIGLNCEPADAC